MLHRPLFFATLCTIAASQEPKSTAQQPAVLDRTGVAWSLPFAAAQTRAKQEQRLIFAPVIAGGTDATGCW